MIKINLTGDFCIKDVSEISIGENLKKVLNDGDINITNFEGPICTDFTHPLVKDGPVLSQDVKSPDFLKENGFNMVTMANNHIMDYGECAYKKTKEYLKPIVTIGAGKLNEAYRVHITNVKNKKIGFLNICQHEFGMLNDLTDKEGVAWMCHPCISKLIIEAKKQCDFLIIIPHAGLEHYELPLPEIRTLYRSFVEIGADAVIGGHPHIPQPWEIYSNKLIVYSLGNFAFNTIDNFDIFPFWNIGLIVTLIIDNNEVSFDICPIAFNDNTIEVSNDSKVRECLQKSNTIFRNEKMYIDNVNKKCLSLEFLFDLYFSQSGYFRPNIRKYIKLIYCRLYNKLIRRNVIRYKKEYLINIIRNETYRWIISRIYELQK